MALSLPDARQLSDEVLEALRLRAVRGCESGFTRGDIAELLGVSQETVSRWWTAYAAGGPGALPGDRTGRPVGSGRTLSDEQARRIRDRIDGHSPEEAGIPSPLWSRRAVRDLIRPECGIVMPVRTVGEYLRRWGYTAKVPRRHARRQDPEEVRRWLEETYPAIAARARAEGAEVYWCDETGVAADDHPRLGYAREGRPATMEVPDAHIRIGQVSAISGAGAVRFMTYKGAMDAALFLVFLGRLLRTSTRKVFLIVDRLPAHGTAAVADRVEAHADRIEVFPMPPRAPELNPDEYLNNDLKGDVHEAGLPANREELRSRVQHFMRRLLSTPEHVMAYFLHPCVVYAACTCFMSILFAVVIRCAALFFRGFREFGDKSVSSPLSLCKTPFDAPPVPFGLCAYPAGIKVLSAEKPPAQWAGVEGSRHGFATRKLLQGHGHLTIA